MKLWYTIPLAFIFCGIAFWIAARIIMQIGRIRFIQRIFKKFNIDEAGQTLIAWFAVGGLTYLMVLYGIEAYQWCKYLNLHIDKPI